MSLLDNLFLQPLLFGYIVSYLCSQIYKRGILKYYLKKVVSVGGGGASNRIIGYTLVGSVEFKTNINNLFK